MPGGGRAASASDPIGIRTVAVVLANETRGEPSHLGPLTLPSRPPAASVDRMSCTAFTTQESRNRRSPSPR